MQTHVWPSSLAIIVGISTDAPFWTSQLLMVMPSWTPWSTVREEGDGDERVATNGLAPNGTR
jgi:hypothetical protein